MILFSTVPFLQSGQEPPNWNQLATTFSTSSVTLDIHKALDIFNQVDESAIESPSSLAGFGVNLSPSLFLGENINDKTNETSEVTDMDYQSIPPPPLISQNIISSYSTKYPLIKPILSLPKPKKRVHFKEDIKLNLKKIFPYNSIEKIDNNFIEDDYKSYMHNQINSGEIIEDYNAPNMEWILEFMNTNEEYINEDSKKNSEENEGEQLKSKRSERRIKISERAKNSQDGVVKRIFSLVTWLCLTSSNCLAIQDSLI